MNRYARHNRLVTYSCFYEPPWSPKYRRAALKGEVAERLGLLLAEAIAQAQGELLELDFAPSKLYLRVALPPHFGSTRLALLIRTLVRQACSAESQAR